MNQISDDEAEAIAEALWDAVLTGTFNLDGKETKVSVSDRIALAMWIIDRIDGPPKQAIDIERLKEI